jgi:hypothetical protein
MFAQANLMMNAVKTTSAVLLFLAILSGCAQVTLRTAWALKDLDYLVVDPGQFRLALSMTEGTLLDKVSMRMQFTRDGIVEIDHDISLDIVTSGDEISRANFSPNVSNGIVLRLPSSRLDDVLIYQRKLQFAREHGQSASASMGIDTRLNQAALAQACADGNSAFRVQAWILVDNLQGYLPLISDSDIARLINAQTEGICPRLDDTG